MDNDELQQQTKSLNDIELEPDTASSLRQQLAAKLVVGQTIAVGALVLMTGIGATLSHDSALLALLPLGGIAALLGLVAYGVLRRGWFRLGNYIFVLGTSLVITANVFMRGYRDASGLYYLWPILYAATTLTALDGFIVALVSTSLYWVLVILQRTGIQSAPIPYDPYEQALLTVGSRTIMFFLLTFLAWRSNLSLNQALRQAQRTAQRWGDLNEALEQHVVTRTGELEQQVTELEERNRHSQRRASQLEASVMVTQAVSSVLDPEQRLNQVVNLISEHFGHYHVGVFMLDESGRWAILRAANSEGGRRLVTRGHRIAVNIQGIVNDTLRTGQARIAFKKGVDAIYFDSTNLPNTHSEMTIPLIARDHIIGALDVHSDQEEAFDQEDLSILSTLANQLAISLENARLHEASHATLSQLESMQRRYVSQAWEEYTAQQETDLYEFRTGEPGEEEAVASLTVPIKMRGGHVVGALGVESTRTGDGNGGWSSDQRALIETVAEQVAQAMEAAQLFDETRRLAQRERLVAEITGKIRAAPDIDTILRTAVQEIRRALRASHGVIRLGTETHLQSPQAPVSGDQAPVSGDQAPVSGDQAPVSGDQAPVSGDQDAIDQPATDTGEH